MITLGDLRGVVGWLPENADTRWYYSRKFWTKFQDLDGTRRQTLLSDPRLARVLYPHIKNAFPDEAREAFNLYFNSVHETAPHILDVLIMQHAGGGGE